METIKEPGLNRKKEATSIENNPGENAELQQAWDQVAEGYNQFVTDTEIWLANEALKRVGLQAGQSFLDVAAGCGGLSLPAARLGAKVLATDWSPEMIRLFEMRVNKEGLSNAKGQVMDGHHLELENNQFDVSGSQFGVMLLPDLPKALKEMVRVTKPGGKVLLIAYGAPEKIDFLNFFIKALQFVAPHFPGLPDNPPPLEFQVADPAVLRQRLVEAGLKNVKVETITEKLEFNSGQQFWDWTLNGNPIVGHVLSELNITDEQIEIIKQQLDQMIRERAGVNSTAILTDPVNIGFGTKKDS
jgi:ubiquinone/menaquinone biosynthesis C-methylase UbiE